MVELIIYVVLLLIVLILLRKAMRYKSLSPFLPRKYNFGKRRDTLRATLALLAERTATTLVETGTARFGLQKTKGDGASTVVFGLWAKQYDAHLHTVDIDAEAIEQAGTAVAQLDLTDAVSLHVSDSVAFLKNFADPVDFLYLDSYDYDKHDVSVQKASQSHHMKELEAIENRLHERSIVLIDDCRQPGGGKGKLVIEHLLARGWKALMSEYQVLLVRDGADS